MHTITSEARYDGDEQGRTQSDQKAGELTTAARQIRQNESNKREKRSKMTVQTAPSKPPPYTKRQRDRETERQRDRETGTETDR